MLSSFPHQLVGIISFSHPRPCPCDGKVPRRLLGRCFLASTGSASELAQRGAAAPSVRPLKFSLLMLKPLKVMSCPGKRCSALRHPNLGPAIWPVAKVLFGQRNVLRSPHLSSPGLQCGRCSPDPSPTRNNTPSRRTGTAPGLPGEGVVFFPRFARTLTTMQSYDPVAIPTSPTLRWQPGQSMLFRQHRNESPTTPVHFKPRGSIARKQHQENAATQAELVAARGRRVLSLCSSWRSSWL